MDKITADNYQLMMQSPATIELYLKQAVKSIDAVFGKGFAKDNPQLVGDFIQACATDYGSSIVTRALQEIAERQGMHSGQ